MKCTTLVNVSYTFLELETPSLSFIDSLRIITRRSHKAFSLHSLNSKLNSNMA